MEIGRAAKRLRSEVAPMGEECEVRVGENAVSVSGQIMAGLPDHLAMECLARVPLASLRGVSKGWQSVIYDPYFQSLRESKGVGQLEWVYTLVQTGENQFKWRAFDPFALQWHDLPAPPNAMEFQLFNPGCIGVSYSVQCASTRNKLVMVAGLKAKRDNLPRMTMEPALDHPYVFDTRTCEWSQGAPFTVPRKWCVCGVTGENLYVASGSGKDWDRELSKSAEVYNLESKQWTKLQNLSSSKFSGEAMNAVSDSGKLYFVSGRGVFSKDGVVYDVATDSWSEMAPGLKRGWTGPCVVVNGRFYLLETPAGKLKVYDVEKDEWETVLVDPLLQNLEVFVGTNGKIVAIEPLKEKDGEPASGGSVLRVIDIASSDVPFIFDIPVEEGQLVSLQVLSMMHMGSPHQ
ncbi:hypothetical protein M758_9G116800 [Ceratodon purpureus]|uniref:F-box domain-containing protein n=1 Tax=Ceratodon purpureus TaxID=3225 RepID=A0A8T0GYC0_CERPU|nr:hypothetical protein KC19_9G101200 [Ceratodon purpureus]KAG0606135.1 hypothetical protein M758_9G116800 [Ceratodon purpureus]